MIPENLEKIFCGLKVEILSRYICSKANNSCQKTICQFDTMRLTGDRLHCKKPTKFELSRIAQEGNVFGLSESAGLL